MLIPRLFFVSIGSGGGGCGGGIRGREGGGPSTLGVAAGGTLSGCLEEPPNVSPTFANSDFDMMGLESKPEKLRFKEPFLDDLAELLCVCPDDRDFDFDLDRRRGA